MIGWVISDNSQFTQKKELEESKKYNLTIKENLHKFHFAQS